MSDQHEFPAYLGWQGFEPTKPTWRRLPEMLDMVRYLLTHEISTMAHASLRVQKFRGAIREMFQLVPQATIEDVLERPVEALVATEPKNPLGALTGGDVVRHFEDVVRAAVPPPGWGSE